MSGNFGFLRADWPELFDEAREAEQWALVHPRTSCFFARRALEHLVKWLFDAEAVLRRPRHRDLNGYLHEPTFQNLIGQTLLAKANIIRTQGNNAVHGNRRVADRDALAVLRELFHVAYWLGTNYALSEASRPDDAVQFDSALLSQPEDVAKTANTRAELRRLAEQLTARDAELAEHRERTANLNAELALLRARIAEAKALNQARSDTHDYDEAHTRDRYIDLLLAEAGWPLDTEKSREYPVTGMPNDSGKGFADYVLWGDDGKPLAVIEAKSAKRNAAAGQQQAKLYADRLEAKFGRRPLIYCTNGFQHWFWDDAHYPPREVQGFHTKDELELLIQRRGSRKPLGGATIDSAIVERDYQHKAIRRITETFERHHQRKALVVMATGAGKTRTVVALADLLQRCNWAKRVLFLADRTALVKQAVNAFKQHLPDSSPVNLLEDKNAEGRVYVSTYPTMMSMIEAHRFGIGHFDLVIIDEAHRSVYQKYRAIFSYFDSLLVGLTATPRDDIDRNTYSLFNLEDGVPTDVYPLDKAIDEGWLVPPRAASVPLRFQREGIRYDELSEAEKEQWDALDWDEDGQIPREVEADAVNKWLFNKDTVDKVLDTLMTNGIRVAGGDRLGKTIVFAKNSDHADFIAARFNANYPEHHGGFARVITYRTDYAQTLIDDFSIKRKVPHIAISVDMLDTGIDVPEVVNLVFFKIVHSKTKFWQMIGRGTRLCRDLFAPGEDKTEFRIFDFCQNFEYFNANPDAPEAPLAEPLSKRLFKARLSLIAGLDGRLETVDTGRAATAEAEADLRRETADLLHRIVSGMNLDSFAVRPQRRWVETYAGRDAWDTLDGERLTEISDELSGLPTTAGDDDEEAKRFDLLILRAQLCVINHEPGFDRVRDTVREIADGLLGQTGIPAINAQRVLLEALTERQWWDDVTTPMLENARLRVRELVKLITRTRRNIVYTDFEDQLGEPSEVALASSAGHVNLARFRQKVRAFLGEHEDHIVLHKIKRNAPLTESDIAELERMLVDCGKFEQAALDLSVAESAGLGIFIRSLVGLDREAVREAFAGFLNDTTLNADQIEFVNLVIEYLTKHGVMTLAQLYEPPFTEIAPRGLDVMFTEQRMRDLFVVIEDVRARASAS